MHELLFDYEHAKKALACYAEHSNSASCYIFISVFYIDVKCKILSPPDHGELKSLRLMSTDGFLQNDQIELKCHVGYHVIGYNVTMCLETGVWSELGQCVG